VRDRLRRAFGRTLAAPASEAAARSTGPRARLSSLARALLGLLAALTAFRALRRWLGGVLGAWLTVEVSGDSMLPALEAGDWLVVRLVRGGSHPLEAGAIALARDPTERLLLKRVIGLPGETVELREDGVHIDGRALIEPYAREDTHPASELRALTRLDGDAYYLLGDHRVASTDSRDHGAFRLGARPGTPAVEGVAVLRYWPPGRMGRLRAEPRRFA
jgi:signal peptidase I